MPQTNLVLHRSAELANEILGFCFVVNSRGQSVLLCYSVTDLKIQIFSYFSCNIWHCQKSAAELLIWIEYYMYQKPSFRTPSVTWIFNQGGVPTSQKVTRVIFALIPRFVFCHFLCHFHFFGLVLGKYVSITSGGGSKTFKTKGFCKKMENVCGIRSEFVEKGLSAKIGGFRVL